MRTDPLCAPRRRSFTFAIDDVKQALAAVIEGGGAAVGDVVSTTVEGRGRIEFAYARDPESNIIELQRWKTK